MRLPRHAPLLVGPLLALLATACALPVRPAVRSAPELEARPVRLGAADLAGWDTLPPTAFEELALARLPEGEETGLDEFLLAELEGALDTPGLRAVRAAVLLGRSGTHAAEEVLLRRLERRVAGPGRADDAADVVAAGALARLPGAAWASARLAVLGAGPDPHPDLEVRVACAAAALEHGNRDGIPFLLQVLRIGTPAGLEDHRDFAVSDTTAWARGDAAIALSRAAGIADEYRTDGPLARREAAAARLAALLGGSGR